MTGDEHRAAARQIGERWIQARSYEPEAPTVLAVMRIHLLLADLADREAEQAEIDAALAHFHRQAPPPPAAR